MDLDLNNPGEARARPVCAVLRCVEESQPPIISTTSQDQNRAPLKNISSLTIFRTSRTTSGDKGGKALGIVVASLTLQQPRITSVSNGIKTDGVLDNNRASLTLDMVKSVDCSADFACQVRSVDANGAESVSVSRVHQSKGRSQADSQTMVSSVSLQILDLVHELDTKLTMVSKFTEKLESKVDNIEDSLNTKLALVTKTTEQLRYKVDSLENRLEDKVSSAERSLRDNLVFLQNRIEDKMGDDLGEKLSQLDKKVMTLIKTPESDGEDVKNALNRSFIAFRELLIAEHKEALTNFCSPQTLLDGQSNSISAELVMLRNFTSVQNMNQNELIENMAQIVANISESTSNTSDTLSLHFTSVANDFQQLVSSVNHSTHESLASFQQLILQTTTAMVQGLLSPKTCTRGMATDLSSAPYPYPIIQPSAESIIDVPYLCDTVTDHGGWIVIQRRTSGDVDFYRGWEEHKNGFGDLRGDFWFGNDRIHKITSNGPHELRVELVYKGRSSYARYGRFAFADEAHNYALTVGNYSGTAGDSLGYHNGKPFTTLDRDNDGSPDNCANVTFGAWWHESCGESSLNGRWGDTGWKGPHWFRLSGSDHVSFSEMKIRPLALS